MTFISKSSLKQISSQLARSLIPAISHFPTIPRERIEIKRKKKIFRRSSRNQTWDPHHAQWMSYLQTIRGCLSGCCLALLSCHIFVVLVTICAGLQTESLFSLVYYSNFTPNLRYVNRGLDSREHTYSMYSLGALPLGLYAVCQPACLPENFF